MFRNRILSGLLGVVGFAFAFSSVAAELYEGTFSAKALYTVSRDREYRIAMEFEDLSVAQLQGKIFSPDSKRCPSEVVAVGTKKDDQIVFRAKDQPELKGCGRLNFKGRKDGDSLIGTTVFEGAEREVLLKRK